MSVILAPILIFAASGLSQNRSATPAGNTEQGCRKFVQDFYDWYVPVALQHHNEPASNIALRMKPSAFDPKLLRLLRRDFEAQSHASEIVGLDFDPFLDTQDPSERLTIQKVEKNGADCLVSVHSLSPDEVRELVAEVKFSDGRWRFANFHYSEGKKRWNLIKELNAWEADRQAVNNKRR